MEKSQEAPKIITFDLSAESGHSAGYCYEHKTGGDCHCKRDAGKPFYKLVNRFGEDHWIFYCENVYEALGLYEPHDYVRKLLPA